MLNFMKGHKPHEFEGKLPVYIETDGFFIHYTCNSPEEKILKKNKISPIGEHFECASNLEVLKIPYELYEKYGFSEKKNKKVIGLNIERILRDLK